MMPVLNAFEILPALFDVAAASCGNVSQMMARPPRAR
jgi:hypothetical protein